jgi:hypothetical protein
MLLDGTDSYVARLPGQPTTPTEASGTNYSQGLTASLNSLDSSNATAVSRFVEVFSEPPQIPAKTILNTKGGI